MPRATIRGPAGARLLLWRLGRWAAAQPGRLWRGRHPLSLVAAGVAWYALIELYAVPPTRFCGGNQESHAEVLVRTFAHEAYARWLLRNQGQECPADLGELAVLVDQELVDPWGTSLLMLCSADAPPEARGFGVVSAGPDRRFGTPDDLRSWEHRSERLERLERLDRLGR